jgi:hypothetical protein
LVIDSLSFHGIYFTGFLTPVLPLQCYLCLEPIVLPAPPNAERRTPNAERRTPNLESSRSLERSVTPD